MKMKMIYLENVLNSKKRKILVNVDTFFGGGGTGV
jgi:hypothetical protein